MTTLHKYQDSGVDWLTSRPAAALFWAPGLGKTVTVLSAYKKLKPKGFSRMLVIAPLRVCQSVWMHEHEKWPWLKDLKVGFAHGPDKKRIIQDKSLDIVLLNYDGILWAEPYLDGFQILCFDELTRMKHTNTRRFKRLKPLLGKFLLRWGLTGTPAPNGLMDLFGQVLMLDGGQRLGPFITKFRFKYFHQKPFDQWTWFPNPSTPKEMASKLKDLAHYVKEEDFLKMPQLIQSNIVVDLPANAMVHYKNLEKSFILKLEEGTVTAANAAVLSNKLRQAAGGAVYDENREVQHLHEAKLDALEDLYEELAGDPLIVAVAFLHEVEAIRKRFGLDVPYLGGGVSVAEADRIIRHWNFGWIPMLIVHPTSVSHGLNLQAGGKSLAWYSQTWNLEEKLQLIRRIWRQGQKAKRVFAYTITARHTIDEYLLEVMDGKQLTQDGLFARLKKHYRIAI